MAPDDNHSIEASWQPIGTIERRVLGVLVEKAKTTPDAYPLTINAITTGANQKSNRSPLMKLDSIDIENALEDLRRLGAVSEVHGSGRAPKYRHRFYEWMGVEKLEAAVMAELLLRGEQTIGELRGRAARMGKIAGVAELQPILKTLMDKGLVQALTPPGRGQVVTHCLYLPEQQAKLERNHGLESGAVNTYAMGGSEDDHLSKPAATDSIESSGQDAQSNDWVQKPSQFSSADAEESAGRIKELENDVESLKDTVRCLEQRLEQLEQLIN